MNHNNGQLRLTVPITKTARETARQFSQQQANKDKAERVYRNTLAVWAVDFYCRCMGIETDLEASDSWDPVMQTLADVADLQLPQFGKIECRPVGSDARSVEIPLEARSNRLGYMAVLLDESNRNANLMGFVETVTETTERLPLEQWRSLDDFLVKIEQLEQRVSPSPPDLTQLTQWLHGQIQQGWESVETLLFPQTLAPAWNARGSATRTQASSAIKRGKLLDLNGWGEPIALLIGLDPKASEEMDISVEVRAIGQHAELPGNLQISILDEMGNSVMQAIAKSTKHIQLDFSGEPNERFSVKVALGSSSFIENFLI